VSCGKMSKRGERQANRQTGAEGARDMWMEERDSERDTERERWGEGELDRAGGIWV